MEIGAKMLNLQLMMGATTMATMVITSTMSKDFQTSARSFMTILNFNGTVGTMELPNHVDLILKSLSIPIYHYLRVGTQLNHVVVTLTQGLMLLFKIMRIRKPASKHSYGFLKLYKLTYYSRI